MATYSDLMQMCRLCLVKDQVSLPIFGGQGDIQQIFLKITACLPVKVSREDNLPKSICDGCSYKLDLLYQFWNTSSNSEKQLIDWLTAAGVDPKHKSLEPIGLATQPNVILKQEPVTELDNISSDTQNYLMQQQQLAYKPEEYEEPQQDPIKSTKQKATSDSADETPSKRPRRVTRNTKSVQEVDDSEEDYGDNTESGIAKTEDESEEEEDEEDEDDGDDGDDGDDMADPDFITAEEEEDTDQPGPSGVSGNKSASATALSSKEEVEKYLSEWHWESELFECAACPYIAKSKRLLKYHMYGHHVFEKPFECPICKKRFALESVSRYHINAHAKPTVKSNKFKCNICDRTFPNNFHVRQHCARNHKEKETCPLCGKKTSSLLHHMNMSHGEAVVCELCGLQCDSMNKYQYHMKKHKGTAGRKNKLNPIIRKKYICDTCGKELSSKKGFDHHMNIHNGIKPYTCSVCNRTFFAKNTLTVHMRTHTGEKPYRCNYCDDSFSQNHCLKSHVARFHSDEVSDMDDGTNEDQN